MKELPPLKSDLDNNLSFLHLNISSLPFHCEELCTLLTSNNLNFDILCISETIIKLNKTSLTSNSVKGCNTEYTTTESINASTLI